MLEVERRERRTESEWGTLCLGWKLRGGNVIPSLNGAPSAWLEVERRECHTESEWGTLCLGWKSRGGNVIPSSNRMEVGRVDYLTLKFVFVEKLSYENTKL